MQGDAGQCQQCQAMRGDAEDTARGNPRATQGNGQCEAMQGNERRCNAVQRSTMACDATQGR
eukprot:14326789-Alexandrium_andersonii.AAC.1